MLARCLARELDVGGGREHRAFALAERIRLALQPRERLAAAVFDARDLARQQRRVRERDLAHGGKIDGRAERVAAALPGMQTAEEGSVAVGDVEPAPLRLELAYAFGELRLLRS